MDTAALLRILYCSTSGRSATGDTRTRRRCPCAGDVIAVWGCGPVGQFAIRSAFLLGAERVIAIDRFEHRLAMAGAGGAETVNYEEVNDVIDVLREMTAGRGADGCIDAVGMEAHGTGVAAAYDTAKHVAHLETDRPIALRQVMLGVRNGGKLAVHGDYTGWEDKIPFGSVMNRGITMRTGQTPVQKYMQPLLERILNGDIDPSFVTTHQLPLAETPRGYQLMNDKQDGCVKVVVKP